MSVRAQLRTLFPTGVAVMLCLQLANGPAARAEPISCQERSERAIEAGIQISRATNLFRVVGNQPMALYMAPDEGCRPSEPLVLMPGMEVIAYVLSNGYTAILWNPPGSPKPGIRWVHSKGLKALGYGIAPR